MKKQIYIGLKNGIIDKYRTRYYIAKKISEEEKSFQFFGDYITYTEVTYDISTLENVSVATLSIDYKSNIEYLPITIESNTYVDPETNAIKFLTGKNLSKNGHTKSLIDWLDGFDFFTIKDKYDEYNKIMKDDAQI